MKNLLVLSGFVAVILITACNGNSPSTTERKGNKKDSTVKNSSADTIREIQIPIKSNPGKVVEEWVKAINAHDAAALGKMYAPKVDFYRKKLQGSQLGTFWTNYFKYNPKYKIYIIDNKIEFYKEDSNIVLALFKLHLKGRSGQHYQIRMQPINNEWKISYECYKELLEVATKGSPLIGVDPKTIQSCDEAIDAILRSAPSVSGLLGQPNARRVTEYRPGDKNGPYGRYQIAIYGYRPGKETEEKLGTFQLDVKTGELYELKKPDSIPEPIPYDLFFKKYLLQYCK